MARETKAEREARIAREEAEQAAMCEKNYPTALMDILDRVNQLDRYFAFDIKDKKFLVTSHTYRTAYYLTIEYSSESQRVLDDLTWEVEAREEDKRDEERVRALRAAALLKLSAEEKAALGIS